MKFILRSLFISSMAVWCGLANAQTAPTAADIASYSGLHLAAYEGRVGEINHLIAQGTDPNAGIALIARQHTLRLSLRMIMP